MATLYSIPKGRFFHSLRWNFVLLGSLGIIATSLLGMAMAYLGQSILLNVERHQLQESSSIILSGMQLASGQSNIQTQVHTLKGNTRYRITIIQKDGTVVADTDADPAYMENHALRPEVQDALHGHDHFAIRYSHTLNQDMLYYARPLGDQVLRVSMPLYSIADLLSAFFQVVVAVLIGAALVMIAVSWRMYRGIIIPVTKILAAAHAWETGNNAGIFHVSRPLELAGISRSMRQMATELNRRIAESTFREQELQRLFEAIREPVLVVDHNQVIRSANAATTVFINQLANHQGSPVLTDEKQLSGNHLLTHIRSSELSDLIQESKSQNRSCSATIKLYSPTPRQFGAYASPLTVPSAAGEQLFILVLYIGELA